MMAWGWAEHQASPTPQKKVKCAKENEVLEPIGPAELVAVLSVVGAAVGACVVNAMLAEILHQNLSNYASSRAARHLHPPAMSKAEELWERVITMSAQLEAFDLSDHAESHLHVISSQTKYARKSLAKLAGFLQNWTYDAGTGRVDSPFCHREHQKCACVGS